MAALVRFARVGTVNRFLKRYTKDAGIVRISTTAIYRYWNKDWKPGPYPKTEEERRAAAEKYYMLPEDYEPCDDDGCGLGDYPKLPAISADNRDPFEDYDFPVLKRNFCEPLHHQFDMLTETRHNTDPQFIRPLWWQAMCFFGAIGAGIAFFVISIPFELARPALPKQYPKDGVKHFTFERASRQTIGSAKQVAKGLNIQSMLERPPQTELITFLHYVSSWQYMVIEMLEHTLAAVA